MSVGVEYHASHTFSDLPYSQAMTYLPHFSYHAAGSFQDRVTYEAYTHILVMYFMCTEDRLISPERQRMFVEMISAKGGEVEVLR
jgi:hypothetical protein